MSGAAPDAGREGFTCSALLMCLYLPGLSKKKPEEATPRPPSVVEKGAAGPPEPDRPGAEEKEKPTHAPSRAASFDKLECASLRSGSNIVFDFVVGERRDHQEEQGGAPPAALGYCPSPCFDLPVELIRAGERYGVATAAADSDVPVAAAVVFDGGRPEGALKKIASCLVPGAGGNSEPRPPHLVRFLSASPRSSAPRSPVTPS